MILGAALTTACGSNSDTTSPPKSDAGPGSGGAAGSGGGGGGSTGGAGTGGSGGGSIPYPAPHPPMPQVMTLNGPVMSAPKIVPISFMGDSLQSSIDTLIQELVATPSYWSGATAEYGVGPLSAGAPQHMTDALPATMTDGDVQAWLTSKIKAGGGFPQPDADTIYALFYPDTTSVTMGGGALCKQFQGYHSDYAIAPASYVTYAVMGRCKAPVASVTIMDNLAAESSHEFIEAATDPLPQDKPAWAELDPDHRSWMLVGGGGEIGDVCAAFPGVYYKPTGIDFLVQRVWSNKAAAASHDPCQPAGATPYFNSAPDLTDKVTVQSPNGAYTTKGLKLPVGQSKTIALHLYSDAPTSGPWKVSVIDVTSAFFGSKPALSFKLDKSTGTNGDTLMLTIKALSTSPLGAAPFWIENDLGMVSSVWLGAVVN